MFGARSDSSRRTMLRTDFASFYYAAKAMPIGGTLYNAKHLDSLAAADGVANHVLPYLYPPVVALAAQPLTLLPPSLAQRLWDYLQVVSFGFIAVLVLLAVEGNIGGSSQRLTALIAAAFILLLPFRANLDYGQINFLVLLCLAMSFSFFFARRADFLAGAALALAALIKVTPAVVLVFFFVHKRWDALRGFFLGLAAFMLVSLLLGGVQPWLEFLHFLPNMGYARNVAGGFHPSIIANFSLAGFFLRLFPGDAASVRLATIASVLILFAALLFTHLKYRSGRNEQVVVLPYLIVMIVASPVAWLHHVIVLYPGIVFAMRHCLAMKEWRGNLFALLLAVLTLLASLDYQPAYRALSLPEEVRPLLTSMNLIFLLLLFTLSVLIVRRERALLVTA
jgi:alpha-1,2-mannosyltransferase